MVLVSYVFGPGLPRSGRCVTTVNEMAKLNRRPSDLACYVVEVCPECAWNHLARVLPARERQAAGEQPEHEQRQRQRRQREQREHLARGPSRAPAW